MLTEEKNAAFVEALEAIADEQGPAAVNWENLICMGIPIYNIFAALYGLPPMPLPSFCSVPPTPTPTPTPAG